MSDTPAPAADSAPLADLYAKDPLDLTATDLDRMVSELRNQRARFNLGEKSAGSAKPKPAKKAPSKSVSLADMDSLDLGL